MQFTCKAFTGELDGAGIMIRMEKRGRVFDNIMYRTIMEIREVRGGVYKGR